MTDLQAVPVAVVDGKDISLREVLYTLKLKGQLGALVSQTVTDRLIADAAAQDGVTVTPAETQKAADAFRMRRGLNRADATHRWLQQNHLNREDLEAGVHRSLLFEKMMHQVASPQRVAEYFDENRARFEHARLSRIVVGNEGLARELLTQLQEDGKEFADLARHHSTDARSKQAGGRIGVVPRKRLPPGMEAAVFKAKPGDVVGPFAEGGAYHLLKVEELVPAQLTPPIAAALAQEIFRQWLGAQAQARGVEVKLDLEGAEA